MQYTFETAHPFAERLDVPPWAARIAAAADGKLTDADHYQQIQRAWVSTDQYQHVLHELLERRILELDPDVPARISPLEVDLDESSAWFPDNNPNRPDLLSMAEQGEEHLLRAYSEAAAGIRPGRHLTLLFTGWDRAFIPMEERVRASVFNVDIGLFVEKTLTPKNYARGKVMSENAYSWKMQEWGALCQRLHVQRIVIGRIVFQRPASDRDVFTIRRTLSEVTDDNEMMGLMLWEGKCLEPGFDAELMDAQLAPGRGWELYVRHELKDNQLVAIDHNLFNHYPFATNLHCPLWLVMAAAKADSAITGGQMYEWLQTKFQLPREVFVRGICALIGAGILRCDLHSTKKQ